VEAVSCTDKTVRADSPALANTPTTLGDLYDAHAEAVYRLLLAILGSQDEAQDGLSEVFMRMAGRNLRRIQNHRAYLLASARRQAISMLRRRRREVATDPTNECFFNTVNLDSEQAFLAHRIEAALRELPAEQREVIVLKVYEGLTFAEIARITRTRPNTAASRYRYAAGKLRRLLGEELS